MRMKATLGYDGDDFIHNRKTLIIESVNKDGKKFIENICKVYWNENKVEIIL